MLHKQSWEGSQREVTANYNPSFIFFFKQISYGSLKAINLIYTFHLKAVNLIYLYTGPSRVYHLSVYNSLFCSYYALSVPVILIEWFARKNE